MLYFSEDHNFQINNCNLETLKILEEITNDLIVDILEKLHGQQGLLDFERVDTYKDYLAVKEQQRKLRSRRHDLINKNKEGK